jgi:hypothetical protein
MNGVYKYTSQQLRMWNEVSTIFLVAIVTLAVVKQSASFLWSLAGLIGFIIVLMSAIKIYKIIRTKNNLNSLYEKYVVAFVAAFCIDPALPKHPLILLFTMELFIR